MTWLQRRITQAKHRLWVNRWFHTASRSITAAACVYAVVILSQRLFELPLPLTWTGLALGGIALLASLVWAGVTREGDVCAAARLDEAAGLRERLSSGWYCRQSGDPFAQAVVTDAERTSSSLSTGRHIRLRMPKAGLLAGASVVLAAMMFLIEPGLLRGDKAKEAAAADAIVTQTKLAVRRKLDAVARMTEANPALNDLDSDVKDLDTKVLDSLRGSEGIRHEAVKKIDRLSDAVRDKRKDSKYDGVRTVRKMMRGLKTSATSQAPTQKLARALRRGDLNAARKEMQAIKEMLATLKFDEDQELVASMTKQLDTLAKQLDKLAKNDKLADKLVRAGLEPDKARRMLEHLKKNDLTQLRKSLEDRGLTEKQVNALIQQVSQHQQARGPARKLAQGMKSAASAAAAGKAADAVAGLSMAEGQLSELEMLEQEMNGLDGALAELQNARNDLDKPCPVCHGTGMRGGHPCPG